MGNVVKLATVLMLVLVCGVHFASAADQKQKRDRKKDGSCQSYTMGTDGGSLVAADQKQKRDRKKDGSCQSYTMGIDGGFSGCRRSEAKTRQKEGRILPELHDGDR